MFRSRMQALANCFTNVHVAHVEFEMDRWGTNMQYSHIECMKELSRFDWKYMILLQVRVVGLKMMYIKVLIVYSSSLFNNYKSVEISN